MKCQSGRHEWSSVENAQRCCNPAWTRALFILLRDIPPEAVGVVPSQGVWRAWLPVKPAEPDREPGMAERAGGEEKLCPWHQIWLPARSTVPCRDCEDVKNGKSLFVGFITAPEPEAGLAEPAREEE